MLAIEVEARKAKESPEALRKRGAMPAVFYGPKEGATAVSIDAHKFEKVWREAGETTVVVLKGIGEEKEVLILLISPAVSRLCILILQRY